MTDTLERVKTYQQFIGGEFVDAADGRTAEVINPANDQVIANVPASSAEDVDRAVGAAATAFETWKKTTPQDRSLLLLKLADALEARGRRARPARERERRQAGRRRHRRDRPSAPTSSASSPAPRGSWTASPPTSSWPATPRSSGATRSASWPRSRPWNYPLYMATLEARAGARDRQHGRAQAVGPDAADAPWPSPRSSPRSSRPASSTSCPARAPTSATRSSATRRSGWSRSPATP